MKPVLIEDRYNQWPDLKLAITAHRRARLAFNTNQSPLNFGNLAVARRLELRLRYEYREAIRQQQERIQLAKEHNKRYAWQIAQRGRTTTDYAILQRERKARRRQARAAARAKREANYLPKR